MHQRQFLDSLHRLGWRRLRVVLVDQRLVLQASEALGLKAPLPLVEAGSVHPAPTARLGDVAQLLSQIQHAQSLLGKLAHRIPLATALRLRCGVS